MTGLSLDSCYLSFFDLTVPVLQMSPLPAWELRMDSHPGPVSEHLCPGTSPWQPSREVQAEGHQDQGGAPAAVLTVVHS